MRIETAVEMVCVDGVNSFSCECVSGETCSVQALSFQQLVHGGMK